MYFILAYKVFACFLFDFEFLSTRLHNKLYCVAIKDIRDQRYIGVVMVVALSKNLNMRSAGDK